MPTCVHLFNFTEKGLQNIKDTVKRAEAVWKQRRCFAECPRISPSNDKTIVERCLVRYCNSETQYRAWVAELADAPDLKPYIAFFFLP